MLLSRDPLPRLRRLALACALAGAAALPLGTAAAQTGDPPSTSAAPVMPATPVMPKAPPPTFAPLARTQLDTVVNISTTQPPPGGGPRMPDAPQFPRGSPFEEFFREFRDRQQQQQQQQPQRPPTALGSGFVIDPSGYVVTNNHVVGEAAEIHVILHDGTRLDAKLVGSDPLTDLALLKVEPKQPLAATRWGDSEKVEVGDWVVAIGNPFGLGGSVTAGILSARARDIQQGPYDEFLQTDASINRGNSGGPLYNLEGEVIGINTAIYSPTGGSVGIGFAIPSALARPVIEQLKDHGEVKRGWLGVQVQRVTQDIADNLGVQEPKGALVTSVTPGGPAEKAGIRQGDVIVHFAGKDIKSMRELPRVVANTPIGREADVALLREGRQTSLKVTVGELQAERLMAAAGSSEPRPPAATGRTEKILGLTLAPLTPALRETFELDADAQGVVVTDVAEGSVASNRGLDPGDIILEVGQEPVVRPEDVISRIRQAREQGRKTVLMLISHQGDLRYVPVPVDQG
ncbi:DegQ family serine endoprotease [Azospirillum sp.]|uniref:DegQ family serine endoprotease n=1 Tax=Azospirillum sp. TaxID=34012 RepID=UPI002D345CEE|nr:DegQ family serine endoprotease [Azospirillum sp.]HYD69377.1 DegQ family serine endoprotease [Azospirillum sp.]